MKELDDKRETVSFEEIKKKKKKGISFHETDPQPLILCVWGM